MIQILLATYNSSHYLAEQLDSILEQDYSDFQLLVRDGGSTDDTLEIIENYRLKAGSRLTFLGSFRSSAKENFSALLEAADAELFMFSDHDDVWMKDKISGTLEKYREIESLNSPATPILIFSDAKVVDSELAEIAPSVIRYQKLDPERIALNNLILQNVPQGNTMLFNRALKEIATPVHRNCVMHDHWLSLCAAAFGKIAYFDHPTLLYRQHRNNVYGASEYSSAFLASKAAKGSDKICSRLYQNIDQAAAFFECYKDRLTPHEKEILEAVSRFRNMNFFKKRLTLFRYNVWKSGFLRNIGLLWFI